MWEPMNPAPPVTRKVDAFAMSDDQL